MRINYIPDKEINIIEQEDLLGTSPYVETLKEIVQICETPFTIGLLGSWGSGKSSIIKTLQEHFNKN
ncbi:MAG: KAP family NTPase, partial [candidate division WOR-3 bacterium]|nr:KAP family NTPase [candidate division WOR-3 bacterium]